ncbi:acyl-CoA Delta-9 desaturase-like [Zophobas morio]|uniref:acyl-CoA Delta-9 desaturase-like n=1 Tax=Zophobas morio TaxID=2755281 RepID=UPI003082A45C
MGVPENKISDTKMSIKNKSTSSELPKKSQIVWKNIFLLFFLHLFALHGIYFVTTIKFSTIVWAIFTAVITGQGITTGAHRLWAHRSYKAKLPLRIILCFLQTMALQTPIYDWVRDHRVHHKFTDTDADPHNASRGFFFSHVGWLLVRKHKQVIAKGNTLDLSDLENDPVVMFQKRYYMIFAPILCLVVPAWVSWYYFEEDLYVAWTTTCCLRYVFTLHATWAVNSVAHIWGTKPYNREIKPTENVFVSICSFGEGWHNYHHVFPWDYKAGEFGSYKTNVSTAIIDLMAKIGWAYDLKSATPEMLKLRRSRMEK